MHLVYIYFLYFLFTYFSLYIHYINVICIYIYIKNVIYIYIYMYILHIYIYVYIYIYIHTYIYIYIFIYINIYRISHIARIWSEVQNLVRTKLNLNMHCVLGEDFLVLKKFLRGLEFFFILRGKGGIPYWGDFPN